MLRRTFEKTEQDICRDSSLLRLVKHDDRILRAQRVNETLPLQHTVRHVLDAGFGARAVLETDRVPDLLAQPAANLLSDTLRDGHGGDTTGLGTPNDAKRAVPIFVQELCKLSGLSRTGLTDHDDDCRQRLEQHSILMP